jgi:hypothetical protein
MRRFLLKLVRRRRLHEDLEAELAFHQEMSRANANPPYVDGQSRQRLIELRVSLCRIRS